MRYVRLFLSAALCAWAVSTVGPMQEATAQSAYCSSSVQSASAGEPVTLSDTAVLNPPSRAVYVGTAGDLKVRMAGDGKSITLTAVPGGTLLPLCADMFYSTGTTASTILVLR